MQSLSKEYTQITLLQACKKVEYLWFLFSTPESYYGAWNIVGAHNILTE